MLWVFQRCSVGGFSDLDYTQAIETAILINTNIFYLVQHRPFICSPKLHFFERCLRGEWSISYPCSLALLESLSSFPGESFLLLHSSLIIPFIFHTIPLLIVRQKPIIFINTWKRYLAAKAHNCLNRLQKGNNQNQVSKGLPFRGTTHTVLGGI